MAFRFVLVSGLGWVLDTAVYLLLVLSGLRVMGASMIGGLCGAAFAFAFSSRFVFGGNAHQLSAKLAVYLIYSAALIVAAAWSVEFITTALSHAAARSGVSVPLTVLAFVAKCLITPLLLATNFFVAGSMLRNA